MRSLYKLLYIITLPDLGGAQVHLNELIFKLPQNIVPYIIIGQEGWLSEKLRERTKNVFIVDSLVRPISPLNDIKAVFEIKKIMQSIQPDIVHCHSSKAGFIGRFVAKLCCVPAVFTAHGWAFTEGVSPKKQRIYKFLEKRMAAWTEKIICVSEYDKKLALSVMPEYEYKLAAIHNGITNTQIQLEEKYQPDIFRMVMVARFSSQKNQRQLIDAVDELNSEGLMIQLHLIGDGPQYEDCLKYATSKLNGEQIKFLGARQDVGSLLVNYDVFCLISNWEGFPISILEAMRAGLPIIASDVGGVSEAVEDGKTGFLVPRGNIESLKEKIKYYYLRRETTARMGLMGKVKFEKHFTTGIMMKHILGIYQGIFDGNK
ncbi:O-antigen biosynthesis glycosyltransferase WbnH [bioreactor metagenome]|uniref:O-antigen biosynthesis glycosyltransferase WbnH n=1 Tax=bioreactor metagenome TaxID=1076179 RepID=A0A644TPG4_9ZZZZ